MAIVQDATSQSSGGGTSSLTFAHTISGSNRYLLVACGDTGGDIVTGVTYNGVAMTQLRKVQRGDNAGRWLYMYGLVAPATGTNNVVVSTSGSTSIFAWAASYTGVNQTGQPDASNTGAAASVTSFGVAVTTVADLAAVIGYFLTHNNTLSAGASTSQVVVDAGGSGIYDLTGLTKTPAGSVTLTVTMASDDLGGIVVSLAPVAAAPAANGQFLGFM